MVNMMKWSQDETEKLLQMRKLLQTEIMSRRQLPDVVGDRRLLRFLRGHGHNVEKACKMYAKFLLWRDEFNVDTIRDHIVYGGMRSPFEFPCGRKIFRHLPQMIMSHEALDLAGNPISVEHFNFNPETVLREITKTEYTNFMIYTLEYKVLMLEQMADEREKKFLLENPNPKEPYGIILSSRVIRDLHGFGLAHIGTDGQTVIKWILDLAVDNYPELLFQCNMINVPWIFNSIWFFMKGLMDSNTVKKVTITGPDYYKGLLKEINENSIPAIVGGKFEPKDILYEFNTEKDGPFYFIGCEKYKVKNYSKYSSFRLQMEREGSSMTDVEEDHDENEETKTEKMADNYNNSYDNYLENDNSQCSSPRNFIPFNNQNIEISEKRSDKLLKTRSVEKNKFRLMEKKNEKNGDDINRKEREIERGYYTQNVMSRNIKKIVQRNDLFLPLNYLKKNNTSLSDKISQKGLKISHILKIENVVKTKETFVDTRNRRAENISSPPRNSSSSSSSSSYSTPPRSTTSSSYSSPFPSPPSSSPPSSSSSSSSSSVSSSSPPPTSPPPIISVKQTQRGSAKCANVGVMSPERTCRVNCSIM